MLFLSILLLSVLRSSSSLSPVLSSQIGTHCHCVHAPFVPGYDLIGQGFDVVTLQSKGSHLIDVKTYMSSDGNCTLTANPLQGNQLQKLPLSVVDWRSMTSCSKSLYNTMHTSVSDLVKSHADLESNDWTMGLEVMKYRSGVFAGKLSNVSKFAAAKSEKDPSAFSTHMVTCIHYRLGVSDSPPLSPEFLKSLEKLPLIYNPGTRDELIEFIRTHGTHYIRQVDLGGRVKRVTAAHTCVSRLNGLSSWETHLCLSGGINVGLGVSKGGVLQKICDKVLQNQNDFASTNTSVHEHYTEVVGGKGWTGEFSLTHNDSLGYRKWRETLKDHPGVVRYSLRPLYTLLPEGAQRNGLKGATENYLAMNGIRAEPESPECGSSHPNLDNNCCPLKASRGTLVVTIVRAWNLYGDIWGTTDGYVKIQYGSYSGRTSVISSNDPRWNARFSIGKVDTQSDLKIEVWDDDWIYDDLLGSCAKSLKKGTHTYSCPTLRGDVEVQYTLTCDQYLTGDKCNLYKPSP
ncbi:perforin-1-like [Xyrichtys novacula]|uniref:Perforin-1-like n=1 Tax=Xyrichtys novacula TaxID=13765 RepID=A0AAV1EYR8_XYRNO|nr:perforin-1-like [Xyrichtys novacula]